MSVIYAGERPNGLRQLPGAVTFTNEAISPPGQLDVLLGMAFDNRNGPNLCQSGWPPSAGAPT